MGEPIDVKTPVCLLGTKPVGGQTLVGPFVATLAGNEAEKNPAVPNSPLGTWEIPRTSVGRAGRSTRTVR